jgi:type VI secretion system protein ImpH
MVQHYFGFPAHGLPFQGRWLRLEPQSWTHLTAAGTRQPGREGLGGDLVLGTRAWHQSASFELQIGPLDLASFQSFLPGDPERRIPDGERLPPLQSLAQLHAPQGMDIRARLVLGANEAKQVPLTAHPRGPRLGYTTWLGVPPRDRITDHVILPLTRVVRRSAPR